MPHLCTIAGDKSDTLLYANLIYRTRIVGVLSKFENELVLGSSDLPAVTEVDFSKLTDNVVLYLASHLQV